MKKILLIITTLFLCFFAKAQDLTYIKDVALVNPDGTLTILESSLAKLHPFMVVTLEGGKAAVRVTEGEKITLKVKPDVVEDNPLERVSVIKVNNTKKQRSFYSGMWSTLKKIVKFDYYVDGGNYVLTLNDLKPGEYIVTFSHRYDVMKLGKILVSSFGVDPDPNTVTSKKKK